MADILSDNSKRLELYNEVMRLHSELGIGYVRISRLLGVSAGKIKGWLCEGRVPFRRNPWNKGLTKDSDVRVRKIAKLLTDRDISDATREKMRLAKLRNPPSSDHIRKMAEANYGKHRSDEVRRKISEANKGQIPFSKGKHLSKEHRKHISEALKGRKIWCEGLERSEETKRRIAEALNGHSVSEESKEKIRKRRLEQVFPVKDTSIEVTLQNELREREVTFRTHVPLLGKYQVDIFIEPDVVVECRGDYWHNRQDVRERDQKRDRELSEAGYRVFSFWEYEIKADPEECIMKVLNGFEESVDAWRSF